MKTFEELKDFYKSLSKEFEGYIQMSDEKPNKIFSSRHFIKLGRITQKNFILEACLFDGDSEIIAIRYFTVLIDAG